MRGVRQVVGFVGVSDLDTAQKFYGETLGLELTDERPFALVAAIGDAMVRITAVGTPVVAPYTVLGWAVDDIAATIDELAGRGVVFARFDGIDQDERGIWTAPDGARIAWFRDPDDNVVSLTEFARPQP